MMLREAGKRRRDRRAGIQPLPVPDPAPHGSAPCAAAALLLPLHPGPRYAQPLSYPYC